MNTNAITPRSFRGIPAVALALAACTFVPLVARAAAINVGDPSFEIGAAVQKALGNDSPIVAPWVPGASWGYPYTPAGVATGGLYATDGVYMAYCNANSTLSQTLTDTLQPSSVYTLSVDVGRRSDLDMPGYSISLYAGTTLLASTSGAGNSIPAGTWITATATYNSPLSVTSGQALKIVLGGSGVQTVFDNVRLDATEVTAPPLAPTNLVASPGNAQVALTWTAPFGTSRYSVKRWTTSDPTHVEIGTPSGASYTDTSAANGTTYYYVVSASNGLGTSADSDAISATPSLPPSPVNDNFANAIALPGDTGTQTGTGNNYATLEADEPNSGASNTVWFKWTAAADGKLALSTLGSTNPSAGGWDAILGIYTGTTLTDMSLGPDLYCPANDYDNIPGSYGNPQDTGSYEITQFSVTADTTYYIRLAGYNNDVAANILLSWSFAASAGSMTPIDLSSVAATAVTASSYYTDRDTAEVYLPEYASDWSDMTGTFPDGLDGTSFLQWSSEGIQDPSQEWIAWDLGASYTLGKVHVWNDNTYANGIKTVDIEVSSDGITWTKTAYTGLSWPDAPGGTAVYAGFDQVFTTPITTRYIRFANLVSHGGWDPIFVAVDEVVFYATTADPFTAWINGLDWSGFTSPDLSPTGEPDGDGMTNQQEYAFGLDPTSGSSVNPISQQLDKTSGAFKYTRRKTSGLTYSYESSTTLSDPWAVFESVPPLPDPVSISDTVEEITVTVPAALINANSTLFLRVKAQ